VYWPLKKAAKQVSAVNEKEKWPTPSLKEQAKVFFSYLGAGSKPVSLFSYF